MEFYIYKNDQRIGPLSIQDLEDGLTVGIITPRDTIWHEGLESQKTVEDIFIIDVVGDEDES